MRITTADPQMLRAVQEMLHGLIRSRCVEFGLATEIRLPSLHDVEESTEQPYWFAIDGMYGGFNITLHVAENGLPTVTTESWSRIIDGAEMAHTITTSEIILK